MAELGPYVGLRPFERDEAMLFFGRREQNLELLDRLHRERFVAVVGRSGCGKSSLIRAGLIPKLEAGMLVADRDRWRVAIMTPGDHPRRALARCLVEATGGGDGEALTERIERTGMAALREHLTPLVTPQGGKRNIDEGDDANLLLLVDQFEEIFRYGSDDDDAWWEEASDFVSLMIGLADQRALPVYVVLTMRSDFLWNCDAFPGLPEAMNRSLYLVPRLTAGEQREAISGPARLFGREISRRLVNRLLNDLEDQPDRLPVLQHALMRIWQGLDGDPGKPIDVEDYEAAGTIHQALERHAEEAMDGMSDAEIKATELIFRTLTDTDDRNRRIRRPALLSELVAVTGEDRDVVLGIIERFRAGGRSFLRLSGEDADPRVDISHESLIRRWPKLRGWVDTEAEDRATYARLLEAAQRRDAGKGALWRDPELQHALVWWRGFEPGEAWTERYDGQRELARKFLDQSLEERTAERKKERQQEQLKIRKRVQGWFLAIVSTLALMAIGFGLFALVQSRKAVQALELVEKEKEEALNAKVEEERQRQEAQEARRRAEEALAESTLATQAAVTSYSPDRSSLVTITPAGTVVLSDAASGEEIGVLESGSRIGAVAFSRDGRLIATCGDPEVRVWRVRPVRQLKLLEGHESRVRKAAFSPDGRLLATAGDDRTARLWDVETGELVRTFPRFKAPVIDVTFSTDGNEVFCWSSRGESKTWSLETGQLLAAREYTSDKESALITEAQKLLSSLGHYRGAPDGVWGPKTAGAVEQFQKSNGLAVDGRVSGQLVANLRQIEARPPEPEIVRFEAVPAEVDRGETAVLVWESANAESVTFVWPGGQEEKVQSVGKTFVEPEESSLYALVARSGEVETRKELELRVHAPVEVVEVEDQGIVFVHIPAGTFTRGSGEVTLSEFWIDKYEVTNEQYRRLHPEHAGKAELPAARVSWHDAKLFCEHFGFELPTEAQWEFAARAGSDAAWSFGDDERDLERYAWYTGNSDGKAHPVGTREPNVWGLHDMHGNVSEWVADVYGPYSDEPQTDPTGPAEATPGASRVLRGGAFNLGPTVLRSAVRLRLLPEVRNLNVGFRCVRRPVRQPTPE